MSKQSRKKTKVVMTLGEFHQTVAATPTETGTGYMAAQSEPAARIDWASEMEKYDEPSAPPAGFVFDRSVLPTGTKAMLAPDLDLESIPHKAPFTAHLSNVSFEADESKIRGFFRDCKILSVRLPVDERGRFKGHGFVEFEDRESLISALQKNDALFFNRQIKVALEGAQKQYGRDGGRQQAGYGGQQHTEQRSDESDWRRPTPQNDFDQQPQQSNLSNKSYSFNQGGNSEYRNRYQGQQGQRQDQGQGQASGGYQQRRSGAYQQQGQQQSQQPWSTNRDQQGQQQQQQRRQYTNSNFSQSQTKPFGERPHRVSEQRESEPVEQAPVSAPVTELKERPKLNLIPRSLPVEEVGQTASEKSASIFGSAKPVNTAAREREIDEKLKREREELAVAKAEREKQQQEHHAAEESEKESSQQSHIENKQDVEQKTNLNENERHHEESHETRRVHRTSYTSDDSRHHHNNQNSQDSEFQVVGGKPRYNKNDNNNNDIRNQTRISQSSSFTSPTYRRDAQQQNQHYQRKPEGGNYERQHRDSGEAVRPATENVWKTRPAANELFNKEQEASTGRDDQQTRRSYPNKKPEYQNRTSSSRDGNTRDNRDRRNPADRTKPLNKNGRSDRAVNSENPRPVRTPVVEPPKNVSIVNKFSKLAVDVEDPEAFYDNDENEAQQEA